jgi:hypothetical protein
VSEGHWSAPQADWRETRHIPCALCGRPLTGRRWEVPAGATTGTFCDPDCEEIYRAYWLPRYGGEITVSAP